MGKPSMFSKDYEKKMKRRRTRNITLSIICLVVIIFGVSFFFLGGSYKNSSDYLTSLFKKDNETQKENIKAIIATNGPNTIIKLNKLSPTAAMTALVTFEVDGSFFISSNHFTLKSLYSTV